MTDPTFYVAAHLPEDDSKITGYVPSKFLRRRGAYVTDPAPGASQKAYLYADGTGGNKRNGRIANPNNYLVVPANYDEAEARRFADTMAAARMLGTTPTLALMTHAFWPGGPEELQRNPRWGIPPNSFVPAYTSAASDHFGYVTGAAGLPRELAENGGGLHNLYSWVRSQTNGKGKIDVSGRSGLSRINEANIAQGYAAGAAARAALAPFNDYGYPSDRHDPSGMTREGVPSFPDSLAGVNPDEPAPAAWPPQTDAPVRYLSSYRAPY